MASPRWIAIAVLAACSPDEPPRAAAFEAAADHHAVPEDWLLAIGLSQSRFEVDSLAVETAADADDDGDEVLAEDTAAEEMADTATDAAPDGDDPDVPAAWGIMQLSDAQVTRGAELTAYSEQAIREDIDANIEAAAALLDDAQARGLTLREATAELLGVDGDPDTAELALADLDGAIAAGFDVTTTDGERLVLPGTGAARIAPVAPGHYPARQWIPSPNFSSRLGYRIRFIVVHDIEGRMASAVARFKQSSEDASAHYIVRARDGHIVQMVHEGDNAWHAGHAWFNRHSIGIEHEGFAFKKRGGGFYNETQYRASAALACAIAKRHGIPIDRKHVFGHYNVPSNLASHTLCSDRRGAAGECGGFSHHADPGRFWKWNHYVRLIKDCVAAAQ